MLAYVFWHAASPGTDPQEYVHRLRDFHRRLQETPPAGFRISHTWLIDTVPWLVGDRTYEDWYVLHDASGLDTLAEVAVSHLLRASHDSVASLAASGVAGLYKPARGERARLEGDCVSWFTKPTGTSYDDLYASLDKRDPSIGDRLWQRFLTLGPTPEFCLVGSDGADLPVECAPLLVSRRL